VKDRTVLPNALHYPLAPFRRFWRKNADAMIEIASLSGIGWPACITAAAGSRRFVSAWNVRGGLQISVSSAKGGRLSRHLTDSGLAEWQQLLPVPRACLREPESADAFRSPSRSRC